MRIPSPLEIRNELPLPSDSATFIAHARENAAAILEQRSDKIALLVGPCSIHDIDMAVAYAEKLKRLSQELDHFYLIMRVFLEKPRTMAGWKGLVYDPRLDGTYDIIRGLKMSRSLLLQLADRKVPVATELLEPLVAPYYQDLLTWGLIGARTTASQPHRQMVSSLPFPVGFKNDVHGELDMAIYGVLSSRMSHSFIHMDEEGRIASLQTTGNPHTHIVLRGSESKPNFDPLSVRECLAELKRHHLEPRLFIDCSHGNSGKNHTKQPAVFESALEQILSGNRSIVGLMLESHLYPGKQPLVTDLSKLLYGVSITDACLGWDETESLILRADALLSSKSMSSAQ